MSDNISRQPPSDRFRVRGWFNRWRRDLRRWPSLRFYLGAFVLMGVLTVQLLTAGVSGIALVASFFGTVGWAGLLQEARDRRRQVRP